MEGRLATDTIHEHMAYGMEGKLVNVLQLYFAEKRFWSGFGVGWAFPFLVARGGSGAVC